MKKRRKRVVVASVIASGAIVAGAGVASAHGSLGKYRSMTPEERAEHREQKIASKAEMLGMTVEALKEARAEGKSLRDIATEQGISEEDLKTRMIELKRSHVSERLSERVEAGDLTQDEADARMAIFEERIANWGEKGFGHRGHRFWRGGYRHAN